MPLELILINLSRLLKCHLARQCRQAVIIIITPHACPRGKVIGCVVVVVVIIIIMDTKIAKSADLGT